MIIGFRIPTVTQNAMMARTPIIGFLYASRYEKRRSSVFVLLTVFSVSSSLYELNAIIFRFLRYFRLKPYMRRTAAAMFYNTAPSSQAVQRAYRALQFFRRQVWLSRQH